MTDDSVLTNMRDRALAREAAAKVEAESTTSKIIDRKNAALGIASTIGGDPNRFGIVQDSNKAQADAEQEEFRENTTVLEQIGGSLKAAANMSAYDSITDAIARDVAMVMENDSIPDGMLDVMFNDPYKEDSWDNSDPETRAMIDRDVAELGLDPRGPEAASLGTAAGGLEYGMRKEEIATTQEQLRHIANSGFWTGVVPYFIGSIPDVDVVVGGGLYSKMKNVRRIQKLKETGTRIKARKLDNTIDGAMAGAASALMVEGSRAAVDPQVDTSDLPGVIAFNTLLGAGIGSALPGSKFNEFMDDTETMRLASRLRKGVSKDKPLKAQEDRIDFVMKSEGKYANVVGDLGGRTMMGISERWYPQQFQEIMNIREKRGEPAAKKYARTFYKNEFDAKVVTNDMTDAQKTVMLDTAVIAGPKVAQDLFKKAKGNVEDFLNLRSAYHKERAGNPNQEQFADGWENRVNNLRDKVMGSKVVDSEPTLAGRLRQELNNPPEMDLNASVGSGKLTAQDDIVMVGPKSKEIIEYAENSLATNDEYSYGLRELGVQRDEFASLPVQGLQTVMGKIYDGFEKVGMTPDYDKAINSGNPVLQKMAITMLSSPLGQIANSRSADNIANLVEDKARSAYTPFYGSRYQGWAKNKGYSLVRRWVHNEGHLEFGREVQKYMAHKKMGRTIPADPHVIAAAEDIGAGYKVLFGYHKKYKTEGFEDVKEVEGHFHVSWDKDAWNRMERQVTTKQLVQDVKQAIITYSPDIDEDLAFDLATAIKRHAQDFKQGSPMSSLMGVSQDGRATIEDVMRERGMTDAEITKRVNSILYTNPEKGTSKTTRSRIGMDYTQPITGTDKTILDLINNDVYGALDNASRGQSGEIGRVAASDGLMQKRDVAAWVQAAEDAARQQGTDPRRAAAIAEDIFSMFNEGAYSGGVTPFTSRLNRAGRLAYLSQLGITQIAETGILMAKSNAVGFKRQTGKSFLEHLKGMPNDVVDAMSAAGTYYRPDELQGRILNLDEVTYGRGDSGKLPMWDTPNLGKSIDMALDKGQRLMGHVSMFYKVTGWQQKLSSEINVNFLFNGIKDGSISDKRLRSMGVDQNMRNIIDNYQTVITRNDKGHIVNLNIENWDPDDLDTLRSVNKLSVDYDVQKTRRGQGHAFANRNDLTSVMTSLKTFAMNAMFSKAMRNARLADRQAAAELAYNMAWSGLAVTASATINGKLDDLDAETLARRTLSWSAHVSPLLMVTDPISYMLGLDYMGQENNTSPLQRYRYANDGLIGMPAPISAVGQLAGVIRTPADLLDDGQLDRATVNSLKAIPVMGRLYGVPLLLDKFYEQ